MRYDEEMDMEKANPDDMDMEKTNPEEKDNESKKKNLKKELLDMAVYCLGVLVICYLIINFIGQRTIVVGDSMQNTLYDGDNLIVDKISYVFKDPERFDIVVFPCKSNKNTLYIKRIIGLPGEKVQIDENGNIYINDQILVENYGNATMIYAGLASEPIYLGADEYFVLGDNRNNSEDSRFTNVGVVDSEDIIGRAILRIFPFDTFGTLDKE